jgi:hypothetical protein
VIAGRDRGQADPEQFIGQVWRDPEPAGDVFAVTNDHINLTLRYQARNGPCNRTPPRLSHDVANIQNLHLAYSM